MSPLSADSITLRLLQEHGLECDVVNEWIVPNGVLPALRAVWHPMNGQGRLDVQVLVRDGVVIEECFAGIGEGQEGLESAIANFCLNSLHPLLTALWGKNDSEQVTTESWKIGERTYSAHVGNFGTRTTDGHTPRVPEELFPRLAGAVSSEKLNEDVHWFRVFVGNVKGDITYEALLDNNIWSAGLAALKSVAWHDTLGFYSVRLFGVLRAT